jgi:hypothetical protein
MLGIGLAIGVAVGYPAGVLSVGAARTFFASMFQDEQGADVAHPVTIDRPAFRLQYPANWRVDTTDSDYDADHMFSIDSPGQSFVMFVVADGDIDPKATVAEHVEQQTSKVMRNATRAPFNHWGAYAGDGMLLVGKQLGITPGTTRIFSFRGNQHTYTLIEFTNGADRGKVSPGFQLVERTFKAKGSPRP